MIMTGDKNKISIVDKCPEVIYWVVDLKDIEYSHGSHKKVNFRCPECKSFETQKTNDMIKELFCKDHGIPLFIIPYTEIQNIEGMLQVFLDGLSIKTKQPLYHKI